MCWCRGRAAITVVATGTAAKGYKSSFILPARQHFSRGKREMARVLVMHGGAVFACMTSVRGPATRARRRPCSDCHPCHDSAPYGARAAPASVACSVHQISRLRPRAPRDPTLENQRGPIVGVPYSPSFRLRPLAPTAVTTRSFLATAHTSPARSLHSLIRARRYSYGNATAALR